jgi:glycogen debranching enzyme
MRALWIIALLVMVAAAAAGQTSYRWEDGAVRCSGKDDQIEVGGPLAGAEFHGSRPVPSRISLFAPVANSIDLSTDYWRRGDSRPLLLGIKVDDQARRWFGKESWEYLVSPQTVRFERTEGDLKESIRYEFGVRDVALAVTIEIRNEARVPHAVEFYTHLSMTLRSCQSYHRIGAARTRFDRARNAIIAEFDDPRLARSTLWVQNVGIAPTSSTADGAELAVRDSGWSAWIEREGDLKGAVSGRDSESPVAAFAYRYSLQPGTSFRIVQLIGSARRKDAAGALERSARGWQKELREYGARILNPGYGDPGYHSGEAWTDNAVSYSGALLAANKHFLDGSVVPMPCPAEYNFFFTHDVLLTDLSAVMFDTERVKRDLLYIASRAKNGDLPHAYYWKDDGYKTEYCSPGNWNNLWAVLATAAYYRHTFDETTALRLYPLLTRALEKTLSMRKGDVLYGIEPDWWDFGNAPGARAYLTILTIQALEEYVYLSAGLGKNFTQLAAYEQTARDLRRGLVAELWDESYLYNSTPAGRDNHIYMGPLLGAVYGILPPDHAKKLVATAGDRLLDPGVGIRTVAPADFHTDSVKKFYEVKSNEAGEQYLYANGGVWYLGNAWYAWALRSVGEIERSFDFFKRTMTLDGILQSPRGQPALYEYRYADSSARDHGRVDKPTLMWSAGFCIGTAYRMAGFEDNVWNVTVGDAAPAALQNVRAVLSFGGRKMINRQGKGSMVTRLSVDGREIPSRILPLDAASGASIVVEMGPIRFPFLDSCNAVVRTASLDPQSRTMRLVLSSFEHHQTTVRILTPWLARSVTLDGKPWAGWGITSTPLGTLVVTVQYRASSATDTIQVIF